MGTISDECLIVPQRQPRQGKGKLGSISDAHHEMRPRNLVGRDIESDGLVPGRAAFSDGCAPCRLRRVAGRGINTSFDPGSRCCPHLHGQL